MPTASVVVSNRRTLIVLSVDDVSNATVRPPFVTLLPAFNETERRQADAIIGFLLARGCVEVCCVGPEAEQLHDSIDAIVESVGYLDMVTTWHTDYSDAFEYFLFAAGGGSAMLVAVVASHPDLVALLEKEARAGG